MYILKELLIDTVLHLNKSAAASECSNKYKFVFLGHCSGWTGFGCVYNMHADCCTIRINIYSEPRSAVINRKAAGEILLSFSLESQAAPQVSGQLVMEMSRSRSHMSTQHV